MSIYDKIRDIDRRVIFLFMALAVIVPLIFQIPFPEITTPLVEKVFNQIDSMPAGSKVLVAFDYDPGSEPELQPMANTFVRQLALRKCKLYFIALWPLGPNMIEDTISNVMVPEFPEYAYGEDYVNLGYKSGNEGVVKVVQSNIRKLYTTDSRGTSVEKIPMLQDVKSIKNMALIVNVSAGYPGTKEWIQYGSDPAGVPLVSGCTAVQTPLFYPYYPNQLVGILGGIKGAAEYDEIFEKNYGDQVILRFQKSLDNQMAQELKKLQDEYQDSDLDSQVTLVKEKYQERMNHAHKELYLGKIRMGPQAVAHLVIMLFIVIGNITFFIDRRRQKKQSL
jgi:hypothetical protein